jgi:hypothetical protein
MKIARLVFAALSVLAIDPASAQTACPNCGRDATSSDESLVETSGCTPSGCEIAPNFLENLTGETYTQTIDESQGLKLTTITTGRTATIGGSLDGWVSASSVYECNDSGAANPYQHCAGGLQANCPAECGSPPNSDYGYHKSTALNIKVKGDHTVAQQCIRENGDGWAISDDSADYLGHTLEIHGAKAADIHDDVIEVDCGSNVIVRDLLAQRVNIPIAAKPPSGGCPGAWGSDLSSFTIDIQNSYFWILSEGMTNWRRYKEGVTTDNYKYQGSGGVVKIDDSNYPKFIMKNNVFLYSGVTGTTSSGFAENSNPLMFPPLDSFADLENDCVGNVIYFAGTGSCASPATCDTAASNTDLGRLFAQGTGYPDAENNYARWKSGGGVTRLDSCFTIITREDTTTDNEAWFTVAHWINDLQGAWNNGGGWPWYSVNGACAAGF